MAKLPNILWIMTDEQRRDSLGCYGRGNPRAGAPHLDALARRGIRFDAAVTPSPMCIPARTSLLSGRYPCETGVWQNAENLLASTGIQSVVADFARAGYSTASFGKQHYIAADQAFEYEEDIVLSDLVDYTSYADTFSEDNYDVVKYSGPTRWILSGRFPGNPEQMPESVVIRRALDWLGDRSSDTPFFLRVSFNGPHTPVVPPEPFYSQHPPACAAIPAETDAGVANPPRWLASLIEKYAGADRLSPSQIESMRSAYYGYTDFIDSQIGVLLNALSAKGMTDDTIVFFVSDHGTHLGDYNLVQKQTFFEPVVTVPCLLSWPSTLPRAAVVTTPVETSQFLPTIAELAGVELHNDHSVGSLATALMNGQEPVTQPVFSEFTLNPAVIRTHERLVMVRSGNIKLSVNADNPHDHSTLVDLDQDPYEKRNVFEEPAYASIRRELWEAYLAHIG